MWMKWDTANPYGEDETLLQSLRAVMDDVGGALLGSSLLYRLDELRQAIAPLAANAAVLAANRDLIVRLIAYEVGHSGKLLAKDKTQLVARRLAGLMVQGVSTEENWYNPEAAIIAHFLAARRAA